MIKLIMTTYVHIPLVVKAQKICKKVKCFIIAALYNFYKKYNYSVSPFQQSELVSHFVSKLKIKLLTFCKVVRLKVIPVMMNSTNQEFYKLS